MRTGLFALAAAALVTLTIPATAQEFRVRAGENGVGVRVGGERHHHDGWRHRGWREGRHGHCRTIIVRHRTPSGNVIIRKTRRCG